MKLRVIQQGQIFVPQYFGRRVCGYRPTWLGFGAPVVKFAKKDDAIIFISLVKDASPLPAGARKRVIWSYDGTVKR